MHDYPATLIIAYQQHFEEIENAICKVVPAPGTPNPGQGRATCGECSKQFKNLERHIGKEHNLSVAEYVQKHPSDGVYFDTLEGFTLFEDRAHQSRIISKSGGVKETLIILRADIEFAKGNYLTLEEKIAFTVTYSKIKTGRIPQKTRNLAKIALDKLVAGLNGYPQPYP